jgi:hypothetical protein
MTFWLTLFTVVAWLTIVAICYALFMCLVPVLAIICAHLGADLSRIVLLNISWSNILSTYGISLSVVVLILGFRLIRSFGRFPRLGRAITAFSSLALVFVAMLVVADSRYLMSFGSGLAEVIDRIIYKRSEWKALNSTRRVIIAEYRYRELHPKVGFTCDLDSLESLGGPAKSNQPYPKANQPIGAARASMNFILIGKSSRGAASDYLCFLTFGISNPVRLHLPAPRSENP